MWKNGSCEPIRAISVNTACAYLSGGRRMSRAGNAFRLIQLIAKEGRS